MSGNKSNTPKPRPTQPSRPSRNPSRDTGRAQSFNKGASSRGTTGSRNK